ncbi:hypothetical protein EON65_08010, partial [archaeon]
MNNLLHITQSVSTQHMSIKDLPMLSDLDEVKANVRSIQLAICCLMLSTAILSETQDLEIASDWLTAEYVQEIAADLLTAVVAYKCQLLASFPTNAVVLSLLQGLQDIESYLILYCQHSVSVVLDAFVVHANEHLRHVLTYMQLSDEGVQTSVVELIMQNLLNTTSYVDQYTHEQHHAQIVMRKCAGHLHHLEEMTKLMDKANSTQFYTLQHGIESIVSLCAHRISSVLERALCIHAMSEESELQLDASSNLLARKAEEDRKRSFRNIISCLEFGNQQGDSPGGHRRPSYVSVSRVTTEAVMAGEAGGKKVGFADEAKSSTQKSPSKPKTISFAGATKSVILSSSLAMQANAENVGSPDKAKSRVSIVQDEHDFYHTLDQMKDYVGSAMLIVVEICRPFFSCLLAYLKSLGLHAVSKHHGAEYDNLARKLHGVARKIFIQVLNGKAFTINNLQVIISRLLASFMHMTVHLRYGLLVLLSFLTSLDKFYYIDSKPSYTVLTDQQLQDMEDGIIMYTALASLLSEASHVSVECEYVGVFHTTHARVPATEQLVTLRYESVQILSSMMTVLRHVVCKQLSSTLGDMQYVVTLLTAIQACSSMARSIAYPSLLHLPTSKPEVKKFINKLYDPEELQKLVKTLLATLGDLYAIEQVLHSGSVKMDSEFGESPETTIEMVDSLIQALQTYLVQLVLEVSFILPTPSISSTSHSTSSATVSPLARQMSRFLLTELSSPLFRVYARELKRLGGEGVDKKCSGIEGLLRLRLEVGVRVGGER